MSMRIVNLIENTNGHAPCAAAHGLSFYIETAGHRLLVDLGPSEETLRNAERLGVDLQTVDTVVLSHGHYDHTGGVMAFAALNRTAPIFMQKSAVDAYYADDGEQAGSERFRYIGIDARISALPQVRLIDGDHRIDDELSLFVIERRAFAWPPGNARLLRKTSGGFVRDSFDHEQCLVIREGRRRVLVSGCAHNGILNILAEVARKFGSAPDAVFSGFHLMKKTDYTAEEIVEIERTAEALKRYDTTYYTCHCTGVPAFDVMKTVLGGQLHYVHSGDEITLFGTEGEG